MVRAGAVGTPLPASGLDMFGDLRKMNKRQVTEAGVGGAPRGRGRLQLRGVRASRVAFWQGQRPATLAPGSHRPWVQTRTDPRVDTCVCFLALTRAQLGEWGQEGEENESSPVDVQCGRESEES